MWKHDEHQTIDTQAWVSVCITDTEYQHIAGQQELLRVIANYNTLNVMCS